MTWKAQNIITTVFSPLLFIGMIIAYVYSNINKVAHVFMYILWGLALVSNITGVVVNTIELYKTRKAPHTGTYIGLIGSLILQLLIAILMIFTLVSVV
jgi:hypothetical protein